MLFSSKFVAIVAPLSALLHVTLVTASPVEEAAKVQLDPVKWRRQEPDDPSNVAAEDETDAEIAADGTGPLRSGGSLLKRIRNVADLAPSRECPKSVSGSSFGNLVSDRRSNE